VRLDALLEENRSLRASLDQYRANTFTDAPVSMAGSEDLMLRIGTEGEILYANTPLLDYLGVTKSELVDQPSSVLSQFLSSELLNAMSVETDGQSREDEATDRDGRIFRVRASSHEGVLDVVLTDITNQRRFYDYVRRYLPSGLEHPNEEALASFRIPERRYMSVAFTDLRGFTELSEALSPEEVRQTLNEYLETVLSAIEVNEATVDKIVADQVVALFGAPIYHADHAVRAVVCACDQMRRMRALRETLHREGRQMPKCGIGLHTGEMVLGNVGSHSRQNYTVIGASVNLASRLCDAAGPGEILLTDETLQATIRTLPENWEVLEITDADTTPRAYQHHADIHPPTPELARSVVLIGPEVLTDADRAEYRFRYRGFLKAKGIREPVAVLTVEWLGDTAAPLTATLLEMPIGSRSLGRYRLAEMLGRGGMGDVWSAFDRFGNRMAVKLLHAGESASSSQLRRFQREADIMARLQHRNICRIYEVGEAEGLTYIAMELLDGIPLDELLKASQDPEFRPTINSLPEMVRLAKERARKKKREAEQHQNEAPKTHMARASFPVEQAVALLIKLCEAIQVAHESGILHRDLKPANIMIRVDGEPVVMDFGLAKMAHEAVSEASLSISGQIFGTIEYMAPEQAVSTKDVDERADVYSLGAILYELITGRRHFQPSGNLIKDAQRLQNHEPVRPRQWRRALDPDLEIVLMKALRSLPEERYRSAGALLEDLRRYQRGDIILAKDITLRELTTKWLKRNRTIAIVTAAAMLLLLLGGGASIYLLNERRLEAEDSRRQADAARQLALEREEAALEAEQDAQNALTTVQRQRRRLQDLLARYETEKLAKGEALLRVTETERQREEAQQEAERLARFSTPYYLDAAETALIEHDLELAEQHLEDAEAINDQLARIWLIRARLAAANFNVARALEYLNQAEESPDYEPAAATEQLRTTLDKFDRVIALLPEPQTDYELQVALAQFLSVSEDPLDVAAAEILDKKVAAQLPEAYLTPAPSPES